MLSLGKLAPGQQQYYLDNVARGAEEYYTGAKEAPGQWMGRASDRLGLEREVNAEALARVLEHVHPDGGYRLTAARSVPSPGPKTIALAPAAMTSSAFRSISSGCAPSTCG